MRAILFRGKCVDSGEWVYGFYSPVNLPRFGNQGHFINENGFRAVEVIPETVGEYTGLTDKKGKKIFEGDILEFVQKVIVRWHKIYGGFVLEPVVRSNAYLQWMMFDNGIIDYEIIGNIYDNPELLEVEK